MSKTICRLFIAGLICAVTVARGATLPTKFLGANSCASTSCHGGGGAKQNQFLVWSLQDFHSQRPPATLTSARSKQIAEALEIKDPTADSRCTSCHAPLAAVPENLRGENFKISEGVSCESCHGPAENWLRAHTRPDYTRADRTAAGLRDLQNLYVRANTCVACHQNVDAKILQAGHPELIFELDGQSVAEPKHWSAEKNGNGAQAWLVGQAVALREMSWQMASEKSPTEDQRLRLDGLRWLLEKIKAMKGGATDLNSGSPSQSTSAEIFNRIKSESDRLAIDMAATQWTEAMTRQFLNTLAGASPDFRADAIPQPLQARRAERLVLALDRLVTALPELKNNQPAQSALNQLFQLAQSRPDFDPAKFAAALEIFSRALVENK